MFGDFGDKNSHDYPTPKTQKMPLKGFTAIFQPKKNFFLFFEILVQFSFFTMTAISSSQSLLCQTQ